MTEQVSGYENYLGALVVNDCPVCDHSHFLVEDGQDYFMENENGGTYICDDVVVEVTENI